MPVGFPVKVDYANGDVLTATNLNDLSGTVNLLTTSTLSSSAGKNGFINGGMDIWQRGTSISVAASSAAQYVADRWMFGATAANQACTVSRQATSDTTNLAGIQYCARVQRNSGQTGVANQIAFAQSIETANAIRFAGKAVTLSFYARAGANFSGVSSAFTHYIATGTGTDQNIISTGYTGSDFSIAGVATLTTTWQRFTLTGTLPAATTEVALYSVWQPVGTAGANDYMEITGVQLELGSTATTFSRAGGTIQGELAACQRYYWRTTSGGGYVRLPMGSAQSTTQVNIPLINPVTMRTTPTTLDYSALGGTGLVVTDFVTNTTPSTFVLDSTFASSPVISYLTATVASGLTAFRPYTIGFNASTTGYIGISAEL